MNFELNEPSVKSCVEPETRLNLSEWMEKHKVSINHTSLNFGTMRAIESQEKH